MAVVTGAEVFEREFKVWRQRGAKTDRPRSLIHGRIVLIAASAPSVSANFTNPNHSATLTCDPPRGVVAPKVDPRGKIVTKTEIERSPLDASLNTLLLDKE
jgi:hypothetical protein